MDNETSTRIYNMYISLPHQLHSPFTKKSTQVLGKHVVVVRSNRASRTYGLTIQRSRRKQGTLVMKSACKSGD